MTNTNYIIHYLFNRKNKEEDKEKLCSYLRKNHPGIKWSSGVSLEDFNFGGSDGVSVLESNKLTFFTSKLSMDNYLEKNGVLNYYTPINLDRLGCVVDLMELK